MEKVKLTGQQVFNMIAAISSLEGRPEAMKDKDGNVAVVVKPFEISGKTRYALAKTLATLTIRSTALEKTKKDIIREAFPDGAPNGTQLPPKQSDDWNAVLSVEEESEVHMLNVSELAIDTNQLAPQVVSWLLPMLSGEL